MSVADRIRQQTEKNLLALREEEVRVLKRRVEELERRPIEALSHISALLCILREHKIDDPRVDEAYVFVGHKKLTGEYVAPVPDKHPAFPF